MWQIKVRKVRPNPNIKNHESNLNEKTQSKIESDESKENMNKTKDKFVIVDSEMTIHSQILIICTGHEDVPNIPKFKNQELFKGKVCCCVLSIFSLCHIYGLQFQN